MADNTIDSLEIKIESSADQAVRSLENLSAKLTTIKNTLGNTNVGFDLSGISKTRSIRLKEWPRKQEIQMDLNKGTAILSSEFRPYKVNEAQIRKALETLSQYQTITLSVLALHDMLIEVHIKKNLDQRGGKKLYGAIDQFPLDVIQKLMAEI